MPGVLVAAVEIWIAVIGAVAVLAGVLVGGLVTTGTTWYFEAKRDKADLRQAKRLVAEELRTVWMHLDQMTKTGTAPVTRSAEVQFLPTKRWEVHAAVLARHLDDKTWDAVSPFMDVLPTHRAILNGLPPGSPLAADHLAYVRNGAELARDCFGLLTDGKPIEPP